MDKKNYDAIDIAKFLSACLVICIHTGPLLDVSAMGNFIVVQILARIAVPFFFVTSGYFFFKKIDVSREWNDYENMIVLKQYVFRLLKIYVIWTILYLPFTYLLLQAGDGISIDTILRFLRDFFFTGSFYHLWFLPALILSVTMVYFMVAKLNIYKTLGIAIFLYLLGMIGNIYPDLLENTPIISTLWKGYSSIFATTRNGFFFGPIFIAIGGFFAIRRIYLKNFVILLAFLVSFGLLFFECFALKKLGFMNDLASMYFMLLPCVSCFFLLLTRMHLKHRTIYKKMRILSLLLYVSHMMFVSLLLWTYPEMNSLLLYFLAVGSSLIFSCLIEVASHKIKILRIVY